VVDLGHVAIDLQSKVVDHRPVGVVLQVAVDVEGRLALAFDAAPQAHQLVVKPVFLARVQ